MNAIASMLLMIAVISWAIVIMFIMLAVLGYIVYQVGRCISRCAGVRRGYDEIDVDDGDGTPWYGIVWEYIREKGIWVKDKCVGLYDRCVRVYTYRTIHVSDVVVSRDGDVSGGVNEQL